MMKGETSDDFDADDYASKLREQGYRDDVIPDLVEKKRISLQKGEFESDFDYVMKLETIGNSNDHIIVAGYASSGIIDHDGEVINQQSLQDAWSSYMENPVLRYAHGKDARNPDAIGRVIPEYMTTGGKLLKTEFRGGKPFIVAEISNAPDVESIRTKINEGVLKGFSVGGRAKKVSEFCPKVGKNINQIFVKRLREISIVDLPANKEGMFEVIKGCVGENCNCDYNIETNLNKIEDNKMGNETVEMEMGELKEFIKSTVGDMVSDQETTEKIEGFDAAVKEITDLKERIVELEAKITAQAATLVANEQKESMKNETETGDKDRIEKLESEIAALKSAPVYKSEQTETIEKNEKVSFLGGIIRTNYGGN